LPEARLVDYWAGALEVAESDAIEQHVFSCEACTAALAGVARIAEAFRAAEPPVVGADEVAALRARGLVVEDNPVDAGARRTVEFPRGVDVIIHHLRGLDLARAERVQVIIRVESTGALILDDPLAPFDRERGEVLIACHRHFERFPPDIAFDVRAHEPQGQITQTTFLVPHAFL
jgi:hypothetical protein